MGSIRLPPYLVSIHASVKRRHGAIDHMVTAGHVSIHASVKRRPHFASPYPLELVSIHASVKRRPDAEKLKKKRD